MSMLQAKENLGRILADDQSRVMALSGKWGTGKSHMWKSVRDASTSPVVQNAIYISLFGAASIGELKLKLIQAAAPMLDKKGPVADAVKSSLGVVKQLGQSVFRLGSALDELALLAVPALLRNKFIVVDDIERKHDKLSIDEVLGFIDDFTQNYQCRMLLILNTDQLTDKAVWEKFREKVIDDELRLDTTPSEACDIAIQLSPSQFAGKIKFVVETCGLTNIRIIRKVIRAVHKILVSRGPLADDVLDRVIPSTVLLAAIHYKGIEGGPTMSFVLDFESSISARLALNDRKRRGADETDEDKLIAGWSLLLSRLGIIGTDEYEQLVAKYLDSGLFDLSQLDNIIERYRTEGQLAGAQTRARSFFQSTIWDPNLRDDEIVEAARLLLDDAVHLDCYTVSSLHDYLMGFEAGEPIARQILASWIARLHEEAAEPGADPRHFNLDNFTGRHLHPDIVAAFSEAYGRVERPKSLLDVCVYLAQNNGWNTVDEAVMRSATADDFARTMVSLRGEQLKVFMLKNLELYANRATYEKHFGTASARFLEACQSIQTERAGTRWATFIKDQFEGAKLGADLLLTEQSSA